MIQHRDERIVRTWLDEAGISVGGSAPWDIVVHDSRLYARVLSRGTLGFGEAYMDGWWDAGAVDELIARLLVSRIHEHVVLSWPDAFTLLKAAILNLGNRARAFDIGKRHYDIGNDLYSRMLDPRLVYTCAYWKSAGNLAEAQEAKLDLVCKKIGLTAGDRVLDIGCGWGSFLQFAAERYKTSGVGVTVSAEQVDLARERCQGLPVEIRLQDYRDIHETFDHIVSLGMFEHVGLKNYRTYMEVAHRSLQDDGLFLLHTIGIPQSSRGIDPWMDRYIFPHSRLPSLQHITRAVEGLFVVEDVHNFGADYDRTLMAWHHNFHTRWPEIRDAYGDRFYRMWTYYLLSCAGAFRARHTQLWQLVLSKRGVQGGYRSVR